MIRSPHDLARAFARIDADVREASPKCPLCYRPDGGVVPSGMTPFEAGLVDRARCMRTRCPMRPARLNDSKIVTVGAPVDAPGGDQQ